MDPAEVRSVHRVPLADLVDPANRCRVLHPSGFVGPGFTVEGMLVWGFTAGLMSGLLDRMRLGACRGTRRACVPLEDPPDL